MDYHFVDPAAFEILDAQGGFLESCEVFGRRYATPRAPVEQHLASGNDVLLEIDVQGAMKVREAFPDAVLVFIRPPDREVQRARLAGRGRDDAATIESRLGIAEQEEAMAEHFDYVVVNDDLDRAVSEVTGILHTRRGR